MKNNKIKCSNKNFKMQKLLKIKKKYIKRKLNNNMVNI